MFNKESFSVQTTVEEVTALDSEFVHIVDAMRSYSANEAHDSSAAVIPSHLLPNLAGANSDVVLVLLPGRAKKRLPELLDSSAKVINETTEDLMECATLLCIGRAGEELRLDVDQLLCRALDDEDSSFVVAVVCEDLVWRRRFLPDDRGLFLDGLQAAGSSSGANYRPYRIYTEEEIEQAACDCQQIACTSAFTPVPLSFGAHRV